MLEMELVDMYYKRMVPATLSWVAQSGGGKAHIQH